MTITTAQIRGARGILNWSQSDLAERTGISATSIGSIENGQSSPRASTLQTIQKAFETSGIEFIGTDGVRLRSGDVRIFQGKQGYFEFFEIVYETLQGCDDRTVYASNVDERRFVKQHGELGEEHLERMRALKDLRFRIMIQEGDTYFPASDYAEYRWLPKEQFSSVPFYVFGDKLAIMLFDIQPTIILLSYPAVAHAYRIQFEAIWQSAIVPDIDSAEAVTK